MEDSLAQLAAAVIAVIAAVVSAYVIPYIKSRTNAQDIQRAETIARIAVDAVEQLSASGTVPFPKKEEAVARATDILNEQGIKVSQDTVSDLVEAAVKELKAFGGELKK